MLTDPEAYERLFQGDQSAELAEYLSVQQQQQCGVQRGPLDPHGQGGMAGAMAWLGARSAQPTPSIPARASSNDVDGAKVIVGIGWGLLCGTAWGLFWWGYCLLVESLQ